MGFNFKRKIREFKRVKKDLPLQVGNIAKLHFVKSFKNEGFTDKSLVKWKPRVTKNKSDRRTKKRRNILVDKGHLRRSIKIGKATFNKIEVGSYGIDYAEFHNKGMGNNPKRQFVGNSRAMNDKIRVKIRREVKKVFKR